MSFPSYRDIEMPLLKLIFERGGREYEMKASDTYIPLGIYFNLSDNDFSKSRHDVLRDGKPEKYWNNCVQWARSNLSKYGYLKESDHGYWKLSAAGVERAKALPVAWFGGITYPDDINTDIVEGARTVINVNSFERNPKARQQCIDHYGCYCFVCGFNFVKFYGPRGDNYIHVHHIVPLSNIGQSYIVNPVNDLRPICPNCHAMVHRTDPPCSLEELRSQIQPCR